MHDIENDLFLANLCELKIKLVILISLRIREKLNK